MFMNFRGVQYQCAKQQPVALAFVEANILGRYRGASLTFRNLASAPNESNHYGLKYRGVAV